MHRTIIALSHINNLPLFNSDINQEGGDGPAVGSMSCHTGGGRGGCSS